MTAPDALKWSLADVQALIELFRDPDVVKAITSWDAEHRAPLARLAARMIVFDSGWFLAGHAAATDTPLWVMRALTVDDDAASPTSETPAKVKRALKHARAVGARDGLALLERAKRGGPSPAARKRMSEGARKGARKRARDAHGRLLAAGVRAGKDIERETDPAE